MGSPLPGRAPEGGSVRAVLFDLDGLLVDSEPLWERATEALLARHGRDHDRAVAQRHMGMRLRDVAPLLHGHYRLEGTPEDFGRELLASVLEAFGRRLRPMPGAPEAVALAQRLGLRRAIASSSPRALIERALERCGWAGAFDTISSGDDVAAGKPAPDIFLHAARELGVAPQRCVALEDSVHGVRAVRAAGMRCVAVPHPAADRDLEADVVLGSLLDLRPEHLL